MTDLDQLEDTQTGHIVVEQKLHHALKHGHQVHKALYRQHVRQGTALRVHAKAK